MSDHYYNAEDLAKFGNVADWQKPLADKFFSYYADVFNYNISLTFCIKKGPYNLTAIETFPLRIVVH